MNIYYIYITLNMMFLVNCNQNYFLNCKKKQVTLFLRFILLLMWLLVGFFVYNLKGQLTSS